VYLLATNILSEFVRLRPNPGVMGRVRAVPAQQLFTSSVCIMELRFGAMRRNDGAEVWTRLVGQIVSRVRTVPFDKAAAEHAGDILAELEQSGQPIGIEDAQIAATALAFGLTVITANTRHFSRVPGLAHDDWIRPLTERD